MSESSYAWKWDTTFCGAFEQRFEKEKGTEILIKDCGNTWRVIIGTEPMNKGVNYWEIEIMENPQNNLMFGIAEKPDYEKRTKWQNNPQLTDLTQWNNSYVCPWMVTFRTDNAAVVSSGDVRNTQPGYKCPSGTKLGFLLDFENNEFVLYENGRYRQVLCTGIRGKTLYPTYCAHYAGNSIRTYSRPKLPEDYKK
eukprot:TRINITY_DN4483_c0_g1_i2.p1 TRINITY_DN4483_c0_g1~~TRINITY_DN4483_c0_g1_i2.p1  ORF type:complete len:202 (-),score=55.39 TRINITY_DN4483_c0_g1_i2:52-636(-)